MARNVQISLDEELLATIDGLAKSNQLSRSAVVRDALKIWIHRQRVKDFEDEWIARLEESPPEPSSEDEAWLAAETWSDE